jgi:large subunit ribosomal protein L13
VVADVLSGKSKPTWTPFLDMGDHVVVINAAKCVFTGKKSTTKMYRRTTTQPGSMVEVRADIMKKTFPSRIIESAVKGMLPKGPLGRAMYRKLKVYEGAEHQHASQQPEPMTIKL